MPLRPFCPAWIDEVEASACVLYAGAQMKAKGACVHAFPSARLFLSTTVNPNAMIAR